MATEPKKKDQINKIIRRLMKEQGFSQLAMAKALGKQRANDVSARLMSSNMTMDKVVEMLDLLGYEVIVQKRTKGSRGKDQIVVARSGDVSADDGEEGED